MELYIAYDVWRGNSNDVANIFENYETIRQIFPEEPSIQVQFHFNLFRIELLQILALDRNHGEGNSRIADVCIENPLEVASVADLPLIHRADPVLNRHNLREIDLRVLRENRSLDSLYLSIQQLNFFGRSFIQIFVEQWHIFEFQYLPTLLWEPVEEASDSTWMNDLIAGAKRQVQKRSDWDARQVVTLAHQITGVVNSVDWECG